MPISLKIFVLFAVGLFIFVLSLSLFKSEYFKALNEESPAKTTIDTNIADQLRTARMGDLVLFVDGRVLLISDVTQDKKWVVLQRNRCENQELMPNLINEVAKKIEDVIVFGSNKYAAQSNNFLRCQAKEQK